MPHDLTRALQRAVSETLENMAFMEATPLPAAEAAEIEDGLAAGLLIHDPVQGEMRLRLPRRLLREIAAAVHALPEEAVSESEAVDVLAEILNTFTGSFLGEIIPDRIFSLGLPETGPSIAQVMEVPDAEWSFQTAGQTFVIQLFGDSLLRYAAA